MMQPCMLRPDQVSVVATILAGREPVSGLVYRLMLGVFAVMPWFAFGDEGIVVPGSPRRGWHFQT